MKKFIWLFFSICILAFMIPIISVLFSGRGYKNTERIKVYITSEDKVFEMDVNEYLKGVVAAEMPAEFDKEALKAQAVAARTYLKARLDDEFINEHKGAQVCTDFKHCTAWVCENDRKEAWGSEKCEEYENKITDAVLRTKGEVLMFEDKIISAVFHSTSSGKTEAAKDVWGNDIAYLVSVESPGDEISPKFYAEKQMSAEEYKNTVLEKYPDADINSGFFEDVQRSDAGGIKTVKVFNKELKGTEFRALFDLRSSNVEFFMEDETVTLKTKGYGHGVGMSQYGADYMAKQGALYNDILVHFYRGCQIKTINL